jgi:hypothetical protein
MRIVHRAVLGATAALAVLGPTGAVAYAAGNTGTGSPPAAGAARNNGDNWHKVHSRLLSALQDRVQTLARLTTSVERDKTLSAQDRSALSGLLANETAGMNQLLAQVQAATPQNTTIAQMRADTKEMVDKYRVYLVMARQVHLTEAADAETAVETRIENNENRIQAAIQKAGSPADAVRAYDDLVAQVAHATQATGAANIPAVLAVTPQGYPGDQGPLTAARTALGQARADLQAARGDLVTIRNVLTQHDGSVKPSSVPAPSSPNA